jgi:O-antigen/teichoic acid export membrane protein
MGTTAVTSLLGYGFWIIAARVFSSDDVGRAAALISAMLLVSIVTNLGIGQVFISRLASRATGEQWSLTVTTGLAVTAVVSLAGGAVAAALLPVLLSSVTEGMDEFAYALLPLGVAGAACSLVLDHACIAEREARPALVRNAAAAALRLILLGAAAVLFAVDGPSWILATWVASFLLFDALALTRVLPSLGRGFRPTLDGWRGELRAMRGLIAGHQSINLGAQAATYLLPLVVSARLGVTETAVFYATFLLANAVLFVAPAISDALFAEGAHRPARLGHDLRRAVRHILTLAGPPALVLAVAGPWLLGLFGPEYADEGDTLLLVLVGSAVFAAGLSLAVAVLRVRGRLGEGALATVAALALAVGSSWLLLPPMGLVGAGVGYAIGQAGGLCLAALFVARGRRSSEPRPAGAALAEPRREL